MRVPHGLASNTRPWGRLELGRFAGGTSGVTFLLFDSDDSVGPATAAVDHRCKTGVGVDEQVEVVTHEFHLVDGFCDRHARRGVSLRPNHNGGAIDGHLNRGVVWRTFPGLNVLDARLVLWRC